MSKNLFETYEVNGRQYTDNLPKNALISIPKKQYIEYEQQREENEQLHSIIKEAREYIDNLKPLTIAETSIKEELKSAYKYFNVVCHLEDFEIAIWNIKEILDKVGKNNE